MKKTRITALILAIAMTLCALTGCSLFKPTAVSLTKKTVENLGKVQSVKADTNVDYEGAVTIAQLGTDMDIKLSGDFDTEAVIGTGTSHVDGSVSTTLPIFGDISIPVESYQQIVDGGAVSYTNVFDTGWVKTESKEEDSKTSDFNLDPKAIFAILQKIVSGEIAAEPAEETEMLGDKEVYKMEVTVSGDLLNEMIKAAAEAEGEDSEALKDIDLTGADAGLVLYIIKDTKLPAKVSIDCTELGNVLMQKMSEDKSFTSKATKFEITMDNIEYDTIDELKIPDEVISSATDADSVNLFENVPGM